MTKKKKNKQNGKSSEFREWINTFIQAGILILALLSYLKLG